MTRGMDLWWNVTNTAASQDYLDRESLFVFITHLRIGSPCTLCSVYSVSLTVLVTDHWSLKAQHFPITLDRLSTLWAQWKTMHGLWTNVLLIPSGQRYVTNQPEIIDLSCSHRDAYHPAIPVAHFYLVSSLYTYRYKYIWLPRWLRGKVSACQCRRCRRCGFDPWVRKIPGRRKWQPTQAFLPGKSHGQRSLVGSNA